MLHKRTESIVQKLSSTISVFRITYNWYERLKSSISNQIRTAVAPYKPHISARVFYFSILLSSIGISFALKDRYSGYWLKPLLSRNLPALGQLQKKMSWETLETVVAEQLGLNTPLPSNQNLALDKIDLYSNFIVMRVNPVWNKLVSQKFVGVIVDQTKAIPSWENKANTEVDSSLLNGLNSHWYKIPARSVVNPLITMHMKSLAQQSSVTQDLKRSIREPKVLAFQSSFPALTNRRFVLPTKETFFTYADEIPYKLDSLTFSREVSAGKTSPIVENLFQESLSSLLQEKSESDSLAYQSSVPSSLKTDIEGINQREEPVSFIRFRLRKGLCINNTQDLLKAHSLVGLSFPSTSYELLEENPLVTEGNEEESKLNSFESKSSLLQNCVSCEDTENKIEDNTAEREYDIPGFDSLSTISKSFFCFEGVLPSSELNEFEELEELEETGVRCPFTSGDGIEEINSEIEEKGDDITEGDANHIDESKKMGNSLKMIEEMGILPSIGAEKFNITFADIITHIFNNSHANATEFSQLLGWGERAQTKQSISFSPIFQKNSWLQPRLMSGYVFLDSNLSSLKPQIEKKEILKFRPNLLSKLLKNGFHLPLEIPLPPTLTSSCWALSQSVKSPIFTATPERIDFKSPQLDVLYRDIELKGSEGLREALLDIDLEKGFKKTAKEREGYTVFKRIGEQDVLQRYRDLLPNNSREETFPSPPETSPQKSSNTFVPFDFRAYPKFFYKGLAFFPDSVMQDLDTTEDNLLTPWTTLGSGADNIFNAKKSDFFGKKILLRKKLPHLEREGIRKRVSVPFGFSDKNSVISSKKLKQNPPFNRRSLYQTSSLMPSKRYLDLLYLTPSEWYTILKKELHLHLVKEAIEASKFRSKAENMGKEYKVREITIFLPSIGMRKAREEAVEWPLTRREYQKLDDSWLSLTSVTETQEIDQREEKNCQLFSLVGNRNMGQESNPPWVLKSDEFKEMRITNHTSSPIQPRSFPSEGLDSIVYGYLPEGASLSFEKSKNLTKSFVNSQIGSPIQIFHLEPITRSSWLVFYRIALWLFVLTGMKYLYRVAFKAILLSFLNGLTRLGVDSRQVIKRLTETPPRTVFLPNRRFQNVAGIDSIIPDLGELVWFLRNSARGYNTPRGILLVGPPGTGKTFLIQAIAGEAEIPVIYESVSIESQIEAQNKTPLELVFRKAQRQAPCILFLDEIDSIGASRKGVITNTFSRDGILDSLHGSERVSQLREDLLPKRTLQPQTSQKTPPRNFEEEEQRERDDLLEEELELQEKREIQAKQISLLGELLKEMDGLRALKGVVVIGATNRPDALDPALLRPGRFEKTIKLGLPGKEKRLDILKLYSKNIGLTLDAIPSMPSPEVKGQRTPKVVTRGEAYGNNQRSPFTDNNERTYWDYLATRTMGLTAADLASAMNHSAIQAIIQNTSHTMETIEYGLDYILGFSEQGTRNQYDTAKSGANEEGLLSLNRLAYYQAGKAVVHTELPLHPEIASLRLWPDSEQLVRKNSLGLTESIETGRRIDFETRLIGFYAGKAAELLSLSYKKRYSKSSQNEKSRISTKYISKTLNKGDVSSSLQEQNSGKRTTSWAWQSDLGFAELLLASSLAHVMVDKWYFYFQGIALRKANRIATGRNTEELQDEDAIRSLEKLSKKSTRGEVRFRTINPDRKWALPPWWQKQVSEEGDARIAKFAFTEWYHIYLNKSDHTFRNEDWVPGDQYYHQAKNIQDFTQNSSSPSPSVAEGKQEGEDKELDRSMGSPQSDSKEITTSFKDWNAFYWLDRDYAYYSLVIACFNRAFSLLDENRELLDSLAYYLLRLHTLRQHEILEIFFNFKHHSLPKANMKNSHKDTEKEFNGTDRGASIQEQEDLSSPRKREVVVPDIILQPGETLPPEMSDIEIIEQYWGPLSRRNAPRFIGFTFIDLRYKPWLE